MSLVDYGSSSDEEDNHITTIITNTNIEAEEEAKVPEKVIEEKQPRIEAPTEQSAAPKLHHPRPHNTQNHNQRSKTTVNRREEVSKELEPPVLKLPDAALLLSSPALPSNVANATDHSSRVAAAMAESASRKRDLNNASSSSSYTRHKVPKGNLPHSKRVPDTVGGNLLPPQLTGRSNVVTEDISKLFVKRHVGSSSE